MAYELKFYNVDSHKQFHYFERDSYSEEEPSRIYPGWKRVWILNGHPHRTTGPAVIYDIGLKEWWKHGLLHNDSGPAVEHHDGRKEWWVNGSMVNIDGSWRITKTKNRF